MGSSKLQKIYSKTESTYGAGVSGDFSGATGVRVHTASDSPIDINSIVQQLSPVNYTIGALDELTPPAISTLEDISFMLPIVASGATRTTNDYTADNLDSMLDDYMTAVSSASASDACDAGCTTTSIVVAGATTYTAGDLIMINGEVRKVATWTGGTKTITVTLPFSAGPSAADVIYNMGKRNMAGTSASAAVGIEHDEANADYLINGVFAEGVKLNTITTGDIAQLEISCRAQSATVGSGLVTAVSTNEIETVAVSAKAGGKVQMLRADGTSILTLCVKEAEGTFGTKNIPVPCFTSTNGIGGFERVPDDAQGSLRIVCWEGDAATRELITALIGETTEIVVQLGTTAGKVVGLYYPTAALAEKEPRFVDMDGVIGIEAMFRTAAGYFFRG